MFDVCKGAMKKTQVKVYVHVLSLVSASDGDENGSVR